jgi:hypothetical protein
MVEDGGLNGGINPNPGIYHLERQHALRCLFGTAVDRHVDSPPRVNFGISDQVQDNLTETDRISDTRSGHVFQQQDNSIPLLWLVQNKIRLLNQFSKSNAIFNPSPFDLGKVEISLMIASKATRNDGSPVPAVTADRTCRPKRNSPLIVHRVRIS